MNKYRISRDIDTEKSHSVMGAGIRPDGDILMKAFCIPLVAPPIAGLMAAAKYADKDVHEITTLAELNEYSCADESWNKGCIYVEHPQFPKRLIEARLYKERILREIAAEIYDYITDRVSVKTIVIGVENKNSIGLGASIPIKKLVADATIKGNLDGKYCIKVDDVKCTNNTEREYAWIKYYPDIVAAANKNSGRLEVNQVIKMNLDVGLGIGEAMKGALNVEHEYSFYVYYERA